MDAELSELFPELDSRKLVLLQNYIVKREHAVRLQERKEARNIMWLHWKEKPLQCELLSEMLDERYKALQTNQPGEEI